MGLPGGGGSLCVFENMAHLRSCPFVCHTCIFIFCCLDATDMNHRHTHTHTHTRAHTHTRTPAHTQPPPHTNHPHHRTQTSHVHCISFSNALSVPLSLFTVPLVFP